MSLINQVLKDLESRKSGAVSAEGAEHVRPIFHHAGEVKTSNKPGFYLVFAMSLLMVMILGWFLYQQLSRPSAGTHLYSEASTPWIPELPETNFSLEVTKEEASTFTQKEVVSDQSLVPSSKPVVVSAPNKPAELTARGVALGPEIPSAVPSMLKEAKTPDIRSKAIFKKGQNLLKRGQLPDAMAAFEESLSVWPMNHQARETMIWVHMRYRMWLHAEEKLAQAMALFPGEVRYVALKARLLIEQKQPEVALSVLNSQTPTLAESTNFYALKAALLQELEQPAEAAELYQALTAYNPRQGAWQMGLGLALEQTGRIPLAVRAYQAALESKALSPESEHYIKKRVRLLQAS